MNDNPSEIAIVMKVAHLASERIARKVIGELRRMKEELAGDDSGLQTVWDAICVQVQVEYSFHWDAYKDTLQQIVRRHLPLLQTHERDAIWLQTPEGEWWARNDPMGRGEAYVAEDDLVAYISTHHVLAVAGSYKNARIEAYLDSH